MIARESGWLPLLALLLGCGRGLAWRPGEPADADADSDDRARDAGGDLPPGEVTPSGLRDAAATPESPPAPLSSIDALDALAPLDGQVTCPSGAHCWSFEADRVGSSPQAPWSVTPGADLQGTQPRVEIDTRAAGESKAVHISGVGQSFATFTLATAPIDPRLRQELYGRMMAWLDGVPGDRWLMIGAEGKPGATYGYGGYGPIVEAQYSVGNTDCYLPGSKLVAMRRWSCIEWHFRGPTTGDPSASDLELWIDGCPVPGVGVTNAAGPMCDDNQKHPWRAPSFDELHLGVQSYVPSSIPFSLWIDDVAISAGPGRIGCPGGPPAPCP